MFLTYSFIPFSMSDKVPFIPQIKKTIEIKNCTNCEVALSQPRDLLIYLE